MDDGHDRISRGGPGLRGLFAGCLLALAAAGCSAVSAIPVTLKEVKDYAVGQEESFSYPLDRVLAAAACCLKQSGFTLVRIERFNRKGMIEAAWQDTGVLLRLDTVTPGLTKVRSKIRRSDAMREFSSEQEIFNRIRSTLEQGGPVRWKEAVFGMVAVHLGPDKKSPVLAWFGPGAKAGVIREQGPWAVVSLMDGGSGYILKRYVGPAPAGAEN